MATRREFGEIVLGAGAAALASAVGEKAVRGDYTKYQYDGSMSPLFDAKTPLVEYNAYINELRSQAATIAQNTVTVSENLPPQGLTGDLYQPALNPQAIIEAALLLAQVQFGENGRTLVANQFAHQGVAITVDGYPAPANETSAHPIPLTLPQSVLETRLPYQGFYQSRTPRDDFDVLVGVNNIVQGIVGNAIKTDRTGYSSLASDVAIGATAASLAMAGQDPAVTRRRFGTTVAIGGAATLGAAYGLNWGGGITDAISSTITTGAPLGSGYNNPSGNFKQLFSTEFFGIDVRNKMITQRRIKGK